ncbi:MAG: prepilin-type N-terminal cleavage/methylation domain-containing protein [Desulfobacterota bacterium]|nr:prepilin-type N-terminal cleavage/methylation domain-containing protein [Thermodesulfobacteriota bacterium]
MGRDGRSVRTGRGFTLIELMIVLAIMSLMLAFAAPRMLGNLTGLTITTAAKKTAGSLRYARSQAVASGIPYAAIFDCEQHRLIVARVPRLADAGAHQNISAASEETPDGAPHREIKIYQLPEGVRFDTIDIGGSRCNESGRNGICQMVFYADGTSQGGKVTIMDTRERRYGVEVDIITGGVTLEEDTEL